MRYSRLRRTGALLAGVLAVGTLAASCSVPAPPPYPYWGPYGSRDGVINDAKARSARLEQYVKDWMDGKVPATLPADLVPDGVSVGIDNFRLQRPYEIDPNTQWGIRPSHPIDPSKALGLFPDPNATYLLMPQLFLPFGNKVIIEGQFPRSRYFSVQPTAAFQPEAYRYDGFGSGEVAWVDADINPNAGHVNPFRVGASRQATNRSYRLECTAAIGDATKLDVAAWTPPNYRQQGNTRSCSGINYRGPWGDPNFVDANGQAPGDKLGLWDVGEIWIRYYAMDRGVDARGGVPLPKVTYQLPDGRQYFIQADIAAFAASANAARAHNVEAPTEPADLWGAGKGWTKQWGIFRSIVGGASQYYDPAGWIANKQYVRNLDRGVTGRAENASGVLVREPHATGMVHTNYLTRGMCLGAGKTFSVSGRLPTFPDTRGGAATMTGAQMRYWSMTGYSVDSDTARPGFVAGVELTSVMDDQLVLGPNREYVIMYGRPEDRPANATAANGVTWVNWGTEACQSFTLRWMSVGPEWTFAKAPHEGNLGWNTDWASANYDVTRIGTNNRAGFLGEYQPVVSYLTRTQVQAIPGRLTPANLPAY